MTGILAKVLEEEEVRLSVGAFEYQVLVPEFVRRQLQTRVGEEVSLHITEYLEGNSVGSRMVPRRIGFLHEAELDFFELFCTVDKIGTKKALKALGRPIREIADSIQRQDVKWLTTLPGIGKQSAETIIATLRTKVTRFSLYVAPGGNEGVSATRPGIDPKIFDDAYSALMSVGLSPVDARVKLDQILLSGAKIASVQDILTLAFKPAA